MSSLSTPAFTQFTTSATTQTTGTYTVPAGSDKRLVVVVGIHRSGSSVAATIAVTHNGVSMTPRADVAITGAPYGRLAIFDLILGSTTPAGTVVATLGASARATILAATIIGVQQSGSVASGTSNALGTAAATLGAAGIYIAALLNSAPSAGSDYSITGCDRAQISVSPNRHGAGTAPEMNLGVASWTGSGTDGATWTVTNSGRLTHAVIAYTDVGGGFQAAWARGSNIILGGGQ